ncbi:MAG: hypothetical protein QNI84_13350 [Henriciella sp.]|nr:hypothetical protein [Henriciella sp.]
MTRRKPSPPPLTSIERMERARETLVADKGRAGVEGDGKRERRREQQVSELSARISSGKLTKNAVRLPTRLTALDMALEARRTGKHDGLARMGRGRNPFLSARHLHAAQLMRDFAEVRASMGSPLSNGARLLALSGSGDPLQRWSKPRETTTKRGKRVEPPPTMKPRLPKERRTGRGPDLAASVDRLQPLSSAYVSMVDAMVRACGGDPDSPIAAAGVAVIVGCMSLRAACIDYVGPADGRTINRLKRVILAGLEEIAELLDTQDFSEPDQLTSAAKMRIDSHSRSQSLKRKAERDALYKTSRWKQRRKRQLAAQPLCEMCLARGITTLATIADHVEPHRGDPIKFFEGELQSLCKSDHDSLKQQQEKSGFHRAIGVDGLPVDANHPYNRDRAGSTQSTPPPIESSAGALGERRGATTSINRNKKSTDATQKTAAGTEKPRAGRKNGA